jgi:hypothetical protein
MNHVPRADAVLAEGDRIHVLVAPDASEAIGPLRRGAGG